MSFVTMELAREIENDRTLERLTNKIKEIIPEIDELNYKCRVKHNGFNKSYWELVMINKHEENFEIIGRDITLEDILRCIQINTPFRVDPFAFDVTITTKNGVFRWFLFKPLHEQSEETIKELNNLI